MGAFVLTVRGPDGPVIMGLFRDGAKAGQSAADAARRLGFRQATFYWMEFDDINWTPL